MVRIRETLLIVGAGHEQTPIIKKSMSRGIKVIAVDGDLFAPGLKMASEHRVVSTRDQKGVLKVAEEFSIDGVTYMIAESPLKTIQYISKKLGLNSPSEKSIDASVSKSVMREIFQSAGIVNPKFKYVKKLSDAEKACQYVGFPLVVKPADSSGQLGLSLVQDPEKFLHAFETALGFSNQGVVIIEEWLEGPELNAVGVVLNGNIQSLVISDRETHPTQAFGVVQRHVFPANLTKKDFKNVEKLCTDVTGALEIENGIIFPQIILTKDGPVMVEFGERIPGGIMKELFEYATGYDLIDLQIDIALGKIKKMDAYKTTNKYASVVVKFINCQPGPLKAGYVSKMIGKERMLKMDGILAADYFFNPDKVQEIKPLKQSANRFYYLVSVGDNRKEACNRAELAAQTIDFLNSEGNSMTDENYYQRKNHVKK